MKKIHSINNPDCKKATIWVISFNFIRTTNYPTTQLKRTDINRHMVSTTQIKPSTILQPFVDCYALRARQYTKEVVLSIDLPVNTRKRHKIITKEFFVIVKAKL